MRRALAAIAIALLLPLGPFSEVASADGPSTGGAARNPNPPPLTSDERRVLAQKLAGFERSRAQLEARRSSGDVSIQASCIVFADIFMEPQDQPGSQNWCGPGSTTAVVTNWNNLPYNYSGSWGTGPTAYMTWLAREGVSGIGPMVVIGSDGKPITYDTTLRATVNNQIGSTFYFIRTGVGGVTNFVTYLLSDICNSGHPLFTVVWTAGLPSWGSYGVAHYQWINSFNDGGNFIQYGDSAGPNASPNGNPFGYHTTVALSTYYNNHVRNANVWDEIIW